MEKHQKAQITGYLKQIGLDSDQVDVYLYLVTSGESSVLAISRGIGSGRTKLYPVLEELAKKQLIIANERHYGSSYSAAPLDAIDFLVKEEARKAEALTSALPNVQRILKDAASPEVGGTKILQFKGVEGLKQANYNLTKANGNYRVFEAAPLDEHKAITTHFAEKMRQLTTDKGTISYDLTNNPDRKITSKVQGYADISRIGYIDPKVFKIEFETYIYNDVVTILNYEVDDLVCLEIHNPALARQYEQLFDLVWKMSKQIN